MPPPKLAGIAWILSFDRHDTMSDESDID